MFLVFKYIFMLIVFLYVYVTVFIYFFLLLKFFCKTFFTFMMQSPRSTWY